MFPCVPLSWCMFIAFCCLSLCLSVCLSQGLGGASASGLKALPKAHLAIYLFFSVFHQIRELETKLTGWNLIFPLYSFSQSFEEIEMCGQVAWKLSAEGREGHRGRVCWPWRPVPNHGEAIQCHLGKQISFLEDSTQCSWTKSVSYFIELDEANHM